jgi:UDP:flavonoid glycosyltransferase YjiC (YdhE family)
MGTMAQALRSGVPSLIVPWGVDQFYTASQMTQTGAGHFLYWRRYTPQRAREALISLVDDGHFRARAGELGNAIAHEDGALALGDAVLTLLSI